MVDDDLVNASNVLSVRKVWADFNDDGTVEAGDLSFFVEKWPTGDSELDIDDSGVVDLGYFSVFINSWLD